MDRVFRNPDLLRTIVRSLLPCAVDSDVRRCRGASTDPDPAPEPHPGYLASYGLDGIVDGGRTSVLRRARDALRVRLVCRAWRDAAADSPGGGWPFFGGGRRELRELRDRVRSRLRRRRTAREVLSDGERADVDDRLATILRDSILWYGPTEPNAGMKLNAGIIGEVLDLLERGASTEGFRHRTDETNVAGVADHIYNGDFRSCGEGVAASPCFAALAILQDVACAAGRARSVAFNHYDRGHNCYRGEPLYRNIFHHAMTGTGHKRFDPDFRFWGYHLSARDRTVVRRLMLGLARVLMTVSLLDLKDANDARNSSGEEPLGWMMYNPLPEGRSASWEQEWELAWDGAVPPLWRDSQDRRFLADFLACASANALVGPRERSTERMSSRRYGEDLDVHILKGMGSYDLEVELELGLHGDEADLLRVLKERAHDASYLDGTVRRHFQYHFRDRDGRSNLISFLRRSGRNRTLFLGAYGGYLVRELVRMKERRMLQVLVEREPPAMAHLAPSLLDYVNSQAVRGRKERIQGLLRCLVEER